MKFTISSVFSCWDKQESSEPYVDEGKFLLFELRNRITVLEIAFESFIDGEERKKITNKLSFASNGSLRMLQSFVKLRYLMILMQIRTRKAVYKLRLTVNASNKFKGHSVTSDVMKFWKWLRHNFEHVTKTNANPLQSVVYEVAAFLPSGIR